MTKETPDNRKMKPVEHYEPGDYRIQVDLGTAREAIMGVFTEVPVEKVEYFNEGVGNVIFRVNEGGYLFKLAKYEKASETNAKEVEILNGLRGRVHTRIPEVVAQGQYSDKCLNFFGYRMVPGRGLRKDDVVGERGVIREQPIKELAEFVMDMHAIDPAWANEHGVPTADLHERFTEELAEARRTVFPCIEEKIPEKAAAVEAELERVFEEYLSNEENFDYIPTVQHDDLEGGGAIMYDEEEGRLAGIIDFGGVQMNDPDADLWRLYAHYGQEFMDKFLEFYPHPDHEKLYRKMNFFWTAQTAHRLVRRLRVGDTSRLEPVLQRLRERTGVV